MAIRPNGTFYNPKTETSKNKNFEKVENNKNYNEKNKERKISGEDKYNNKEHFYKTTAEFFNKKNSNLEFSGNEERDKVQESINIQTNFPNSVAEAVEKLASDNLNSNNNLYKEEEIKNQDNKFIIKNKNNLFIDINNNNYEENEYKNLVGVGETTKKSIEEKRRNSKTNLDKFKNLVSFKDNKTISAKRIKTAGDYQPKRSDFNLEMAKNPKTVFEMQSNCAKEYERMIKTSHENRKEQKEQIPNTRVIKQKMLESDIFFFSNKGEDKAKLYCNYINNNSSRNLKNAIRNYNYPPFPKPDYLSSDVFIMKNNETSQKKIGEKYLMNDNKFEKIGYHPSNKSNSEWSPKNYVKSYMNYNSCDYDLFNPFMKKSVYTKDNINKEASGVNPNHRQKCITEFVDLTRNFVPNCNKDFVNAIAKDDKIFSRKQDLCTNFIELHKKEYSNICNQPFVKKFV